MKTGVIYFKHDSNARQDERILDLRAEYGWEGYGLYWAIVETMCSQSDYKIQLRSIKGLSLSLGVKHDFLNTFLDYCCEAFLFKRDEQDIYSNTLINRMQSLESKKKQYSDAAKKASNARWENKKEKQTNSKVDSMRSHTDSNAIAKRSNSDGNAKHDMTLHDIQKKTTAKKRIIDRKTLASIEGSLNNLAKPDDIGKSLFFIRNFLKSASEVDASEFLRQADAAHIASYLYTKEMVRSRPKNHTSGPIRSEAKYMSIAKSKIASGEIDSNSCLAIIAELGVSFEKKAKKIVEQAAAFDRIADRDGEDTLNESEREKRNALKSFGGIMFQKVEKVG